MIFMSTDDLSRYSLQTDDGAPTNVDINAGYWDAMIRGLRDRLHSATQSWEACGRERDQLRKELAEANGDEDKLVAALEESNQALSNLKAKWEASQRGLVAAISEEERLDEANKELNESLAKAYAEIKRISSDRATPPAAPASTPDQLRKDLAEVNESYDRLADKNDQLAEEVDFLKTMLTGADAKVKRLEGERATSPVAPVPASDPILALASRLDNLQGEINGVVDAAGMRLEGHEDRLDRLEEQIAEFAVGGCRPAREAGRRIAAAEERVKFCLEAFESVAAKMDHPKIVALLRPGTGEPAHWASNTREEKS